MTQADPDFADEARRWPVDPVDATRTRMEQTTNTQYSHRPISYSGSLLAAESVEQVVGNRQRVDGLKLNILSAGNTVERLLSSIGCGGLLANIEAMF